MNAVATPTPRALLTLVENIQARLTAIKSPCVSNYSVIDGADAHGRRCAVLIETDVRGHMTGWSVPIEPRLLGEVIHVSSGDLTTGDLYNAIRRFLTGSPTVAPRRG